jgi:hypothetical protein
MGELKLSPLPKGGKTFSSESCNSKAAITSSSKRSRIIVGQKLQATYSALGLRIQIYISTFKCLSNRHATLSSRPKHFLIGSKPKGSQRLFGDWIHLTAFVLRCFANRGSGDCLLRGIVICFRWPIPRGSVRPQSCVRTMRHAMLSKLQSLFSLPKMEL